MVEILPEIARISSFQLPFHLHLVCCAAKKNLSNCSFLIPNTLFKYCMNCSLYSMLTYSSKFVVPIFLKILNVCINKDKLYRIS